ncbi:MAG TPA: GAF and ANTAR domain-containing protein [Cryptosporangiaceae bacterium]|nr:GAF and ANTAR domain-containing protein [Cryptosporangiaceae bacterium]
MPEAADVLVDSVGPAALDEVTGALESLVDVLDQDEDLDAILQRVCEQVTRAVPGADLASVTLIENGEPRTAASTSDLVRSVDAEQYRAKAGPCLQAASTGEVVRADADEAMELWPEFTRCAHESGLASFLSAPLVIDARNSGAFNLYGRQRHGFGEIDVALLELYTVAVQSAMRSAARYVAAREMAAQLSDALVSRAVIDQAKGMIMAMRRIGAEEAFAVLVEQSQRENVKLRDLAARLVDTLVDADA